MTAGASAGSPAGAGTTCTSSSKHEDHIAPGANGLHRSGGEWRVEHPRVLDILDAVRDAAEAAGIAKIEDFNTGDNTGSTYFQVNQKRGLRVSANSFVKPIIDKRDNLRLEMKVLVERIVVENGRATAIEFTHSGEALRVDVDGEVIHSAGAVGSPALLGNSGIGDGAPAGAGDRHRAASAGRRRESAEPISRSAGLQGRGRCARSTATTQNSGAGRWWRWNMRPDAPGLTIAPSQVGAFAKSSPDYATANLQFHFQPLSLDKWGDGLHPFGALHQRLQSAAVEPGQRVHHRRRRVPRTRRRSRRTISIPTRTSASPSTR